MDPDTKNKDLLYISDLGTDDVYVYSYPKGKLKGTLTGFNSPVGLCSDKAGDVWIVNAGASQMVEYAHGGNSPVATLSNTSYGQGCAVDPTTGNLAVANYYGPGSSKPGNVAIYPNAQGTPTIYTDSQITDFLYCGYDGKGDLYADGYTGGVGSVYGELTSGSSDFTNITLNASLANAEGVQWHGKYLAIVDSSVGVIYQFAIRGRRGTEAGSTTLTGANGVYQFWIQGPKVIGPNTGSANVMFWKYPAGGTAIKTITGLNFPFGSTVSMGRK
jgi:hypothetical protein